MPTKTPKTKPRQIRIPDADWSEFLQKAEEAGRDRSALVREFIHWYLRRPGAKLPQRPPRDEADASS